MVIPGRMVAVGLAALLLGGAGIAVAATRDTDTAVEAVAPAADDQSQTTTTTTEPSTTPIASSTSTTEAAATTTTTTTARRATTTVARVTTTRRPASSTTTPKPAVAACVPAQIAVAIATDRPSYAPGQQVKVTSTLRNTSSVTCSYNGYSFTSEFKDETGKSFGGAALIADSFADVPFAPGQVLTNSASWDHRQCPEPACAPLPPGVYTVVVTWGFGATYEVSTSLILS